MQSFEEQHAAREPQFGHPCNIGKQTHTRFSQTQRQLLQAAGHVFDRFCRGKRSLLRSCNWKFKQWFSIFFGPRPM